MGLTAHPIAALFPLLGEDEIGDLAEDIKIRGLIHPIVVDAKGQILDGRNRYLACHIAGIEPAYERYDGDDPGGYALAVNIARRHLSKGQQAMILVKAAECLETKQSIRDMASNSGLANNRISYANTVLQYAPDLVDDVINGASLDAAYKVASEAKKAIEEQKALTARLLEYFSDLAELIASGEITTQEALNIVAERGMEQKRQEESLRNKIRDTSNALATSVRYLHDAMQTDDARSSIRELFDNGKSEVNFPVTKKSLKEASIRLANLADMWE